MLCADILTNKHFQCSCLGVIQCFMNELYDFMSLFSAMAERHDYTVTALL